MRDFTGRLAVITGGGSGIGRALALQLASEGCSLALCDISEAGLAGTKSQAEAIGAQGVRVSTTVADVTDEAAIANFRTETLNAHQTDHIHLLFNNAGVGGGGSFLQAPREQWDRVFDVCWNGVYRMTRAFLPLLVAANEGHIVNVSSVNGFWACFGTVNPHTAYSAAKFAVKGFTEALIIDLRVNAPHVKASVVMPGHIGTDIVLNSFRAFGGLTTSGADAAMAEAFGRQFRDAGTRPEQAAAIILDGVRHERWRILVGPDAEALDRAVRAAHEQAYEPEFGAFLGFNQPVS